MEEKVKKKRVRGTTPLCERSVRQIQKQKALEEILDVRGLSKLRDILIKYDLSNVTIDYKLNVFLKRNREFFPNKEESCKIL